MERVLKLSLMLLLTVGGIDANVGDMESEIRDGSFVVLSGSPPRGASGVVLAGQSIGSAEIELYATRHDDVDGLIPFGWSSNGPQPSMVAKIV